jgi:hypothetical protein
MKSDVVPEKFGFDFDKRGEIGDDLSFHFCNSRRFIYEDPGNAEKFGSRPPGVSAASFSGISNVLDRIPQFTGSEASYAGNSQWIPNCPIGNEEEGRTVGPVYEPLGSVDAIVERLKNCDGSDCVRGHLGIHLKKLQDAAVSAELYANESNTWSYEITLKDLTSILRKEFPDFPVRKFAPALHNSLSQLSAMVGPSLTSRHFGPGNSASSLSVWPFSCSSVNFN